MQEGGSRRSEDRGSIVGKGGSKTKRSIEGLRGAWSMVVGRGGRKAPGTHLVRRWKGKAKNPIELGMLSQCLRLCEEGDSVTGEVTIGRRLSRTREFIFLVD